MPAPISSRLPCIVATLCTVIAVQTSVTTGSEPEEARFFELEVRPLLVEHCVKCHGPDKQKGGLRVDELGTLLTGGESGPALVPGHPELSLLIEAINYESYEMPPGGKLNDEQIEVLTTWVRTGARWPGADPARSVRSTEATFSEEDRQFWSFQPLRDVAPPAVPEDAGWATNGIDRFILSALHDAELSPAEPAPPSSLIRRLYLDVVGLPPTPQQVDEFLSDPSDQNYFRIVDRLLESPGYGEHAAHYWLDLVRYADSDGYKADGFRPDAWRYRDYVIQAFNDDMPYDRFLLEQLAGDEIAPEDPQALAATGFLRHGIYEYNQRDAYTQRQDMLNDITDTTADVFLGLGMGCARCHDHKFDPLLQRDYYRLQAFFAGLSFRDDVPFATPSQYAAHQEQAGRWREQTRDLQAQLDALEAQKLKNAAHQALIKFPEDIQAIMHKSAVERSPYETQIAQLVELQVQEVQAQISTKFKGTEKEQWEALRTQLSAFDELRPKPLPSLRSVTDVGPTAPVVHIPGKERLGEIAPGFLSILDEGPAEIPPVPTAPHSTGRRTALARWLTRPDHPLTSRVIVNRIWQQHFGTGLVATPSDFGRLGEVPSHPELLDWLAVQLVESGWRLKSVHRLILTSSTFRQTALRETPAVARKTDPENRLLWRQNIRRLDAEQIRDSMLAITDELVPANGGPPEDSAKSGRRTIYTKLLRNQRDELLTVFDLPDRITGTSQRNTTTTPTQSLLMFNSPATLSRGQALAARLQREIPGSDDSLVRHAYSLAFCRVPTEQERARAIEFLEADTPGAGGDLPTLTRIMPGTGSAALLVEGLQQSPPQLNMPETLPAEDFTVSAVVLLESLYPDATVRTIASHWDGDTTQPGWSLGVTSTRSKYQPRHLILQLVGNSNEGPRSYEVIPSGIHLELNRPYRVTVAVRLQDTSGHGISFHVRDLSTADAPAETSTAAHRVVSGYHNSRAFAIGGRDGSTRHRWHGLIDDVHLAPLAVDVERFEPADLDQEFVLTGHWTFDDKDNPFADRSGRSRDLSSTVSLATPQRTRLVDFCHVLLNSNEFLYVD